MHTYPQNKTTGNVLMNYQIEEVCCSPAVDIPEVPRILQVGVQ